jgi:hypothetical protein
MKINIEFKYLECLSVLVFDKKEVTIIFWRFMKSFRLMN